MAELMVDDHSELRNLSGAEDLFSILETWEECVSGGAGASPSPAMTTPAYSQSSTGGSESGGAVAGARPMGSRSRRRPSGDEKRGVSGGRVAPVQKKQKCSSAAVAVHDAAEADDGEAKISHIAVERNRRKQMNEHLAVLRSLMPCFYVKRGDQASIIGGVVDYIKELQQVLRSLEAKKHRKAYAEQVLSPRPTAASAASPRPLLIKPTPPPLSPRVAVPISPRTPTPGSPYKPPPPPPAASGGGAGGITRLPPPAIYMAAASPAASSSSSCYSHDQQLYPTTAQPYLPTLDSLVTELAAQAAAAGVGRPAAAAAAAAAGLTLLDVRVEFAGPNLVLKTVSHRAPGQALKIIATLESLSLEILHVSVTTVNDDTMVHSFTIKIGIECELSAEELVHEIRQTFL
ncbi:unnamed protein product [Urochloa humidicola]